MSNMSYCRFENTASDLRDCADHILEELDDRYEGPARKELATTCKDILESLGFSVVDDESEAPFSEAILLANIQRFCDEPDPDDVNTEDQG